MEYAIGPVLALLLGLKFTDYKTKKHQEEYKVLVERVEKVGAIADRAEFLAAQAEAETFKKVVKTIQPVAVAVKNLNDFVGIR
jgi:hypothetical protein